MQYPSCVAEDKKLLSERSRAGLCADCLYARRVEAARGSIFYLCERSASDPAFIFSITRPRCTFTVTSLVPSSPATCLLSSPETTRAMTSRSRGVNDS